MFVAEYFLMIGRYMISCMFFFHAEDGIRYFCLSRGFGDVYKGQMMAWCEGQDVGMV